MYDNIEQPTFHGTYSLTSKTFVALFFLAISLWIISIIGITAGAFFSDDNEFYSNKNRLFLGSYILFSFLLLGIFSVYTFRKEPFYSHIIIDEEGITYFDKYHYRPSKSLPWSALCINPKQQHADIQLQSHRLSGSFLLFWAKDKNGENYPLEENFGGYGYLPFIFKNKKQLQSSFLSGILTFRKDLEIDPELLHHWDQNMIRFV